MPEYIVIPFVQLLEPKQPVRFAMDDAKLAELCDSVKAHGILQNLGVVLVSAPGNGASEGKGGRRAVDARPPAPLYEIVFGHRRYKAAQIVGLKELPCAVFASKDIAQEAAMLDENLCREDITAAEEAIKYTEIIEKY